ncbi:EAL domain-containing protein [Lyngbya sp. CCY1209]|uniref:two-component system response regulator n=1 Tax=Lyngbya sp. CCY1209 TaxID=2886103 RepID=UPI002D20810B|nr:EAL domain-containing protein [Lyngbya sp. CCY1209]MEB3881910.1 EAL domain-containing protein [Lyngbya sp. CCY1209]
MNKNSDPPPARVLIVDDTPHNLRLLSAMLNKQGYAVECVTDGGAAIKQIAVNPPDLVLLDILMPNMDGYEVCERLKASEQTSQIPVIFLSALGEVFDKIKAFEVGGIDYITKPFEIQEVLARVRTQLEIRGAHLEVEQMNLELERRVRERTRELADANQQLLHMASHDALTGLPNRVFFMERLMEALNRTQEERDRQFAVLFLDCDNFKIVNDSLGHLVGDRLMMAVAKRLKSCIIPNGFLARFEGDEFTILIDQIKDIDRAKQTAKKIHKALTKPFYITEEEIFINASIGIVLGTHDYDRPEDLLRDADTAMYQAKAKGKARYQVFDAGMHAQSLARLLLENDLRRALQRNEFILHYQPIVHLATNRIAGFEALVRWHHPTRGVVSPYEFIPATEETGLIVPLGQWIMEEACRQIRQWQEQCNGGKMPISIGVNLSVKQFCQHDLIEQIDNILARTGLDPSSLKLEITETALIENERAALEILQQFRDRKIQLGIDDFGTGYSSLSYLHNFPIDTLKIDRSFITRLTEQGKHTAIIQAIVSLAQNLGMTVIAEGVEIAEQVTKLKELGCEYGQGYFFSKPLAPEMAWRAIASQRR